MKITNLFNTTNIYSKNIKQEHKIEKPKNQNDSLEVSGKARDFQNVLKAISNTPDIRADKVEQISKKIENGSYNVSTEDLVDKMLSKF